MYIKFYLSLSTNLVLFLREATLIHFRKNYD